MDDEREPVRRPGAEPDGDGWDDDPWIIIDDTEDGAAESPAEAGFEVTFGTVPIERPTARRQDPPPSRPQDPRQSAPRSHGWSDFANNETWNGMAVTPPGATFGTALGADAPESADRPEAGATQQVPAIEAWEVRSGSVGKGGSESMVEGPWFIDNGDDVDEMDDAGGSARPARSLWAGRLSQVDGVSLGRRFVTLTVVCLSALLVISSIIWHPHAP